MDVWNIILLLVNIMLILVLTNKVRSIIEITKEQEAIKENIEKLVNEHSQIANLVIDQLESKLTEARAVIDRLNDHTKEENRTVKAPADNGKESMQFNEENYYNLMEPTNSKIIYMKQMGMSSQEIAEKLNMSQGEIDLKINLQEKQDPSQIKKRKSR